MTDASNQHLVTMEGFEAPQAVAPDVLPEGGICLCGSRAGSGGGGACRCASEAGGGSTRIAAATGGSATA